MEESSAVYDFLNNAGDSISSEDLGGSFFGFSLGVGFEANILSFGLGLS